MRILMMEGNTIEKQQLAHKLGVRTATEIYTKAVRFWAPDIDIDVVNAADGEKLPFGKSFTDYDGMIISGSGLRAFHQTPEVLHQLDLLSRFGETGRPILGSCWGLQIAAVVAGGTVGPSSNGRELGVARKISLTDKGKNHPFFADKPLVFDAACIHYDEILNLPDSATLLCSNDHSKVQGAIIPIGKSELWGVQYHPEFDLTQIRMLYQFYEDDMFEQHFVNDKQEYDDLLKKMRRLEAEPNNKALAWQLGIDRDILNDQLRSLEIRNWLRHAQA